MFVPSLSWYNEHLYIKMAKKDAFSYLGNAPLPVFKLNPQFTFVVTNDTAIDTNVDT